LRYFDGKIAQKMAKVKERISMDETLKNQRNEDTGFIPELKMSSSWYHHVSHIDIDTIAS